MIGKVYQARQLRFSLQEIDSSLKVYAERERTGPAVVDVREARPRVFRERFDKSGEVESFILGKPRPHSEASTWLVASLARAQLAAIATCAEVSTLHAYLAAGLRR